jgi:putative flippase GtrA
MEKMPSKHVDKVRFAIVGFLNTAIDFAVLFTLIALGLTTTFSNFLSTSTALTFSFFANKSFTFQKRDGITKIQFIYFLIITLFGLWVIQPFILEIVVLLFAKSSIDNYVIIFIGKIIATLFTLVWNYLLYRKFVFTKDKI